MSCLRGIVLACILGGMCGLFPCRTVYAARTLTLTSDTDRIVGDASFRVTASVSGFIDGETISIKGAFFYPGSTNYFGYTKRSDDTWVKNGETTGEQAKVVIGVWDGTLLLRADSADSGYQGEGEYQVKLGFYYVTGTGSLSTVNWSANTLPITITQPDPTITPTLTPLPTSTPSVILSPTVTPHPTRTPTPSQTTRPVESVASVPINRLRDEASVSGILGVQDIRNGDQATTEASVTLKGKTALPVRVFAFLFIGVGIALIAFVIALRRLPLWKTVLEQSKKNRDL